MRQDPALNHLVERAFQQWEARRRTGSTSTPGEVVSPSPPAFTIALEREAGTGGTAVAKAIGDRLGWLVYDQELLERIAQEMGVRTALLKSVDERIQSWLLETVEAFLSFPAKSEWDPLVSESGYIRQLITTVLALGQHGECVIVGRGAAFILPAKTTLRVRLVAPVAERIALLSRQRGLSRQEATREVRKLDRERTTFIRNTFLKDPSDPLHYDQILNAARFSVEGCAEAIIGALRSRQTLETATRTVESV
jgi:cytidylate kinase